MVSGSGGPLVECVPNFSEGRRPEVMDAIQAAAASVLGLLVLDRHHDAVHNRMVLTFAGPAGAVVEGAFRCAKTAADHIDLNLHRGVHPRMGATDVIPFVPLGTTPMATCVELASRLGRRIAAELDIPVYLYGEAATRAARRRLPDVRRGEYEEIQRTIATDPDRTPDFGANKVGPAGVTAVGARPFLVAFNVNIATGDLTVAKIIAKLIRESDGGLPAVQAKGFLTENPDVVQVSMNLMDTRITPLHVVFDRVAEEARLRGVEVVESELVGLAPTAVMAETTRHYAKLPTLTADQAIEARMLSLAFDHLPESDAR